MNVLICGAGQVGFNVAKYLSHNGVNVTIIDHDESLIQNINERLDVKAIYGHASHPDVLKKAGAKSSDMLIAVTQEDEVNIVACEMAQVLFEVPIKIARIRSQAYLKPEWQHIFSAANLSIDYIISPEVEVAQALTRGLAIPGAFAAIPFADRQVQLIGIRTTEDTPILNTPISHLGNLFPHAEMTIVGIRRGDISFIPEAQDRIMAQDDIYFITLTEHLPEALKAFGVQSRGGRKILVLGGGNIGLCLGQQIEQQFPDIRLSIIEKDLHRAEYIAQQLKHTTVICGDALESEILEEAGVHSTETVVSLTEDDRVNTLAGLLAKRLGAQKVLSLINSGSLGSLVTSLGVDAVISPRVVTVSRILQIIQKGKMLNVHSLGEGFGEVIEIEASMTNLVGQQIGDVNQSKHMLISAMIREDTIGIPSITTIIRNDDRLIIMVSSEWAKHIGERLGLGGI